MIIQKKLTREDALKLLELGYQMHQESPNFRNRKYDRERIWKLLDQSLLSPSRVCVLIAKEENTIIGFLVGTMTEQYFSGDLLANDLAMYILPEHRGGRTFFRLLEAFEEWSISNKATAIILGHTTGINLEKSKGLFLKRKYSLMGHIFTKEL